MDMGAPAATPGAQIRASLGVEAERAHAGLLSFEFSVGRHRIVTNCGSGKGLGADWERMARSARRRDQPARAGRPVTVSDPDDGRLDTARLGVRAAPLRGAIGAERLEDADGPVLDGFHDLYAARFGMRASAAHFP